VANALIRAVEALKDPHQDNATVVAVRLLPQDASSAGVADATGDARAPVQDEDR
jgi:protein phosphatase